LVSLEFFIDIILLVALWPWGWLSLEQKWVPGIFSGRVCIGSQCVGLITLPPSCANCLEIWEPQPPGIVRACPCLQWDCFTFYCAEFVRSFSILSDARFKASSKMISPHSAI